MGGFNRRENSKRIAITILFVNVLTVFVTDTLYQSLREGAAPRLGEPDLVVESWYREPIQSWTLKVSVKRVMFASPMFRVGTIQIALP